MPSFASQQDRLITKAAESWWQIAFDEVEDIGGWRDADPCKRSERYWSRLPVNRINHETEPQHLFGYTQQLYSYIVNHHPSAVPAPLLTVYEAIKVWHRQQNADGIMPQIHLEATLDRACMVLAVIHDAVQGRVIREKPADTHTDNNTSIHATDLQLTELQETHTRGGNDDGEQSARASSAAEDDEITKAIIVQILTDRGRDDIPTEELFAIVKGNRQRFLRATQALAEEGKYHGRKHKPHSRNNQN